MPIRIKSKKKDFRRCGVAHPDQWTEYPDDKFTKEDLAVLKKEPMLIVETVTGGKKESNKEKVEDSKTAPKSKDKGK